jgi:hypothetical protein
MNFLWVLFTVFASGGQVARNAMQRELTARRNVAGLVLVVGGIALLLWAH